MRRVTKLIAFVHLHLQGSNSYKEKLKNRLCVEQKCSLLYEKLKTSRGNICETVIGVVVSYGFLVHMMPSITRIPEY